MENNQVDINLSTDIKTDNLVPLNITLMSRDINNSSFLLKFKSNGADVQLNNSFTVEVLSVFPNSKIEILTQATVYGNTAVWEFDTKYITRNEVVYNYVYVKKDGAPIISADANAFTFNVGLSKIDGNAGKTAETYDRNYEKVLHEFEVAINLTKDEWAQMADEARNFVDEIKDVTVDEFVELKMGEELANLETNYATRLTGLEQKDNQLTAQLAQKADKHEVDLKISQTQSGVKGTYPDISDLESSLPNGDEGNYVIASDGHIYTWDGGAWVDTGIQYQATGIARGSVSPAETTFFEQQRINLFDKTTITTPGIVNPGTGTIVTTGALAPQFAVSDFIPVIENQTYEISFLEEQAGFAWYRDTSLSSYISGGYVTRHVSKHTSPTGARYLRITFKLDYINMAMVAKDTLPSEYVAYEDVRLSFQTPLQRKSVAQEVLREVELEMNGKSESAKRFENQTWTTVGDSITEKNFRASTHYHDHVSSWLGMTVDNQGYSGTGYLQTYNTSLKIPDRLDLIDPDTDLITVFAGVNDRSRPLGEFGDTDKDTTIYGAIDYTLRKLIENFPNKKIAVFTPTPTSTDWGINNNRLQLIADAVIKTANHYSIPCLDLYRGSGLRPWNADNNKEFFSTTSVPSGDGLHMNDKGQLWIACRIYEFLLTL